mgnify:FL=1
MHIDFKLLFLYIHTLFVDKYKIDEGMNVTRFEINKVYNFTTLAAARLGSVYREMRVKSIMTASEALRYRDIHTLHNNLIPIITNLPVDTGDCTFLLLENTDKEVVVLAIEYIDPVSVILVSSTNIRIEITDATSEDVSNQHAS